MRKSLLCLLLLLAPAARASDLVLSHYGRLLSNELFQRLLPQPVA